MSILQKDIFEKSSICIEIVELLELIKKDQAGIKELAEYCRVHFKSYTSKMSWSKRYIQIRKDCSIFWIGGYERTKAPRGLFKIFTYAEGEGYGLQHYGVQNRVISSARFDCDRWIIPDDVFQHLCETVLKTNKINSIYVT